jgi:hypothetical protein
LLPDPEVPRSRPVAPFKFSTENDTIGICSYDEEIDIFGVDQIFEGQIGNDSPPIHNIGFYRRIFFSWNPDCFSFDVFLDLLIFG